MKIINQISKLIVAGGFVSTTLLSGGVVITPAATAEEFSAPHPALVIAPASIPRDYQDQVVRLKLTIDAKGRARAIDLLDGRDPRLVRHLLPVVAKWQFTPAMKNGEAVTATVVLPLRLVEGANERSARPVARLAAASLR